MQSREIETALQNVLHLQRQGQLEEAERTCRSVLAKTPENALATHLLGLLECQRGFMVEGLSTLDRSLKLAPNSPDFHNNMAGILGQQKKFAQARVHIHQALQLKPDFGLAFYNLGVNSEHTDQMEAAEVAYRRAIALMPDHLGSQYRLGCVLYYLGKHAESEQWHLNVFEPHPLPKSGETSYPALVNPGIVVVVTCKGRLKHLQQTLPRFLEFHYPYEYRVVAVDYGDPDNSFNWCASLRHPRLAAVRILDDVELFHKSRAFNCGANLLSSDILCFVDADSLLDQEFLHLATEPLLAANGVLTKRQVNSGVFDTVGVCCVRTAAYRAVGGYDEALQGYGPEDMDFFARVRQQGTFSHFPSWLYPGAITHSNEVRTRFYSLKDTRHSAQAIVQRLLDKSRRVNPNGYGRARCEFASIETNFAGQLRTLAPP